MKLKDRIELAVSKAVDGKYQELIDLYLELRTKFGATKASELIQRWGSEVFNEKAK